MRPHTRAALAAGVLCLFLTLSPPPARGVEIQTEIRETGLLLRVPGIYWEFSVERADAEEGAYAYLAYRYIGCTESCEYLDPAIEDGATYWYRVRLVDRDGETIEAGPAPVTIPASERGPLRGVASPNPFLEAAAIGFRIPVSIANGGSVAVAVTVYDATGRAVRRLSVGDRPAGTHAVAWDGRNDSGSRLASGVYFARIQVGGFQQTLRMLKIR